MQGFRCRLEPIRAWADAHDVLATPLGLSTATGLSLRTLERIMGRHTIRTATMAEVRDTFRRKDGRRLPLDALFEQVDIDEAEDEGPDLQVVGQ